MAYIADPSNPGWVRDENADPALESSWWQIPEGFVADPNNQGWYYREGADVTQQANWVHDPSIADLPQQTGLVRAIDVASYQATDLTALIQKAGASHVVVRMYQQTVEGVNLQNHSRAQVDSARANGCSIGAYLWLYASVDPYRQVGEAFDLAQSCGIGLKILWLDIEPYTDGSLPSAEQIKDALDACQQRGVQGGIYSGAWVWPRLGNPSFPGVPCWWASYDGVAALDVQPLGGMVLVGKQYSDKAPDGSALDCDVFDASVI